VKKCPKCGFRDNPKWRHSRFDFNADYMRFEEALKEPELKKIAEHLKDAKNFVPCMIHGYAYYRRGTNGLYFYRVLQEDFKIPRERVKHKRANNQPKLEKFGGEG